MRKRWPIQQIVLEQNWMNSAKKKKQQQQRTSTDASYHIEKIILNRSYSKYKT